VPPLGDIAAAGVPFGAGTDGTRASSWNPWRSLHWLVTGESWDGGSVREERHRLSRTEALRAYTHGNTWFSSEESVRGRLAPGYLADLAVLDRDYFSVDTAEIPAIRSELTLVGGEVAYSSGALTDPA
jgi:predicted amidohydrolase YtcJ